MSDTFVLCVPRNIGSAISFFAGNFCYQGTEIMIVMVRDRSDTPRIDLYSA